jgi:ABC-type glycerol-3-phosphate transport system substrate-binding protein
MENEKQAQIESALQKDLAAGRLTRREFMQLMMVAGLGAAGVSALGAPTLRALAQGRPLTPTFYQWIVDYHKDGIDEVDKAFPDLNFQIAPVSGFGIERFVAEGKNKESTWDVYVGMTPFVEMADLIKADVIEPWDNYIPKDVLDDIIPSIRAECTVDGKLYSWPFLLDVIVQAYHSGITTKAGLPDKPTADWDEYLANSQTVLDKGAARYGCTFDSNGWRSLCPITHSISTDVYYNLPGDPTPLYDFTSDPAIQALQLMKKMLDLSSANALQPGTTDGGVNNTPDEVAFASQAVAYYIKYQNSPLRFAQKWGDNQNAIRLGALPKAKGGVGATVFWTTGACLFKYGQNKEKAAEYMKALTYNPTIWKNSIAGTPTVHMGQLPPYKSVNAQLDKDKPDWYTAQTWAPLVRAQLDVAKAIPNHAFGLHQFQIGKQFWEKYLTGEEKDPKVAMQAAKDAVVAEIKKTS